MYHVSPQWHYPHWYGSTIQCPQFQTTQQPAQPTQPSTGHSYQLPDRYPQLANRLATLAQNIKNGTLTLSQVKTSINTVIGQIPVETVKATLKGAACMLSQSATGKASQQNALTAAGHAVQGAANQISKIKQKVKPKTTT